MYFRYFVIISPWKRRGPFIWTNLSPHHPRMHWAKFGWNWPSGSGEEIFFLINFDDVFSLFHKYLPLEKGGALHLNKLESLSPKDALRHIWLKLARWFWRRRCKCEKFTTANGQILIRKAHLSLWLRWANNISHHLNKTQPPIPLHPGIPLCQVWLKVILLFCKRVMILSKEHHGLLFEETWIPCFLSSLIEIGPVVQDTKKKKQFTWQTKRQQVIRINKLSFHLIWCNKLTEIWLISHEPHAHIKDSEIWQWPIKGHVNEFHGFYGNTV